MPQGFFTIEQYKAPKRGVKASWVVVAHLDGYRNITQVIESLEQRGRPGFYRVVQTQRMVVIEKRKDGVKSRKWHAMTYEGLMRAAAGYVK